MTTLAVNKPRVYEGDGYNEIPVIAADIIFEGAAVGDNASGYARPLVAGDPFLGFADQKVDNSLGSAGDKSIKLRRSGFIVLPITSAAITDRGKAVYASDDDTFTFTKGSNTLIGYVHRWLATGSVLVRFDSQRGAEVPLTDSSGGTAADTIAAIGGSYSQTEVRNAIASLAAKINVIIGWQGN